MCMYMYVYVQRVHISIDTRGRVSTPYRWCVYVHVYMCMHVYTCTIGFVNARIYVYIVSIVCIYSYM